MRTKKKVKREQKGRKGEGQEMEWRLKRKRQLHNFRLWRIRKESRASSRTDDEMIFTSIEGGGFITADLIHQIQRRRRRSDIILLHASGMPCNSRKKNKNHVRKMTIKANEIGSREYCRMQMALRRRTGATFVFICLLWLSGIVADGRIPRQNPNRQKEHISYAIRRRRRRRRRRRPRRGGGRGGGGEGGWTEG